MTQCRVPRRGRPRRALTLGAYALLGVLLIAPTVLIFSAVIVYPLLSAIYLSLFSIFTLTLEGGWVGLDNYAALLAVGEFWRALWQHRSGPSAR